MKKEIPIKNLYYLLSYAWNFVSPGTERLLGTDNFSNSTNLLARLMDVAVKDLVHRGITKEYISEAEEIRGIRGKLVLSKTLTSGRLKYGKTICSFDEFGLDHPLNQVVKAAIRVLVDQKDLEIANVIVLRGYLGLFEQISNVPLSSMLLSKVQLHSNTRHYRFALELCRLISSCLVVSSESRELLLSNFLEDSVKMDRIFEKFIKNFYSYHLKGALVGSPKFDWEIQTEDALFAERVPELRTDVVIDMSGKRLIIDAKYYVEAMKQSLGGRFKYRRDHLSQLMEYLRTSRKKEDLPTRGMLLYPTVDTPIDNSGKIEGFEIRVATIDLSLRWEDIEQNLLRLTDFSDTKLGNVA